MDLKLLINRACMLYYIQAACVSYTSLTFGYFLKKFHARGCSCINFHYYVMDDTLFYQFLLFRELLYMEHLEAIFLF